MVSQVDPRTLAAIGGQQAASAVGQFAQTMSNLYQVSADRKDRQMKRALHDRQMESLDLKIEAQKQKGLGAAATAGMNMLDNIENPMNFIEQYRSFRSSLPDGVREDMPDDFQSLDHARAYFSQQMAQSDKLLPYLELQKKGSNMKQWQVTAQLLAIPPEERTRSQNEFLDYYAKRDTNIYVGQVTKAQREDVIMGLQGYTMPGQDKPILDLLDEKSQASFISAVTGTTQALIDDARKRQEVLSRPEAMKIAIETHLGNVETKESLGQKIPWAGQYFDSDYVFNPGESVIRQITGHKPTPEEQLPTWEEVTKQTPYEKAALPTGAE